MTVSIVGMPIIFLLLFVYVFGATSGAGLLLPFIGSGFVPTASMPTGVRQFAQYQPFTPVTETLRGLLMGTLIGNNAIISLAWCASIALVGYRCAKKLFNRDPAR